MLFRSAPLAVKKGKSVAAVAGSSATLGAVVDESAGRLWIYRHWKPRLQSPFFQKKIQCPGGTGSVEDAGSAVAALPPAEEAAALVSDDVLSLCANLQLSP